MDESVRDWDLRVVCFGGVWLVMDESVREWDLRVVCFWGRGRLRCSRRGSARVKNLEGAFIVFFLKTEPVRFGSVFSVSGLSNRNRTEPVGFLKILIGLIGFFLRFGFFGYFFSGFLGLIGFSVFLLTPSSSKHISKGKKSKGTFGNATAAAFSKNLIFFIKI